MAALLAQARALIGDLEGALAAIKKRYSFNTVVLGFSGDGGFLNSLPELEKVDLHRNYAEVRLRDGADPTRLLEAAMGQVKITRFEVVEPTLNSIFIDLVGGPSRQTESPPAADPEGTGAVHV